MLARIHDLLEIDAQSLLNANSSAPAWVAESLAAAPFVVVRRGLAPTGEIAVGVRGGARNQRWAGFCAESWIRRAITPAELLSGAPLRSRAAAIPALRALVFLARHESWSAFPHQWGPGGSVGFELATGRPTATPRSDLDIVIYADERLSIEEANRLHAATQNLASAVDVRVETPVCGFSLAEYASRAPAPILLRGTVGAMLGIDPWRSCSNSSVTDPSPSTTTTAATLSAATLASHP
jgi:phosphoribosyl-dephospho-CoA transferase